MMSWRQKRRGCRRNGGERGQGATRFVAWLAAVLIPLLGAIALYYVTLGNDAGDKASPGTSRDEGVPAGGDLEAGQGAGWEDCDRGFDCATLRVPLDYGDPEGETVRLALIRLPARDDDNRIGSLVVNPGGPGGSGVEFVREASRFLFSNDVRRRFDIVGFDPRGVGGSVPAIDCIDDPAALIESDVVPGDEQQREQLDRLVSDFVDGCEERSGGILPFVSTENVAHDLDRIREAVGDEKLTYLGFSYGTLIGATYANLYPENVRALVLDGAVDPSLSWKELYLSQARGFEASLSRMIERCDEAWSCRLRGVGRAGEAFDRLMSRLEREPMSADDGRQLTSALAWRAVAGSLYSPQGSYALAEVLAEADDGDATNVLELADAFTGRDDDGEYSNEMEASIAIGCIDWPEEQSNDDLADEIKSVAPRFSRAFGYFGLAVCDRWPVATVRTPAALSAGGVAPILVIGTLGDPATPYEHAVSLAQQLESGVLLTYDGEGHTAYGGESACVTEAANAYLIELAVPADGGICSGPLTSTRAPSSAVVLNLDSVPGLEWKNHASLEGTAEADVGTLTIDAGSSAYQQFILEPGAAWYRDVSNEQGWVVEARLKIDESTAGSCGRPGGGGAKVTIWTYDHVNAIRLGFTPHGICLLDPIISHAMETTDEFHVYRIESRLNRVQVYVDGQLVIDHAFSTPPQTSGQLLFGDGGGSGTSRSEWDYFWYDTAPTGEPPTEFLP